MIFGELINMTFIIPFKFFQKTSVHGIIKNDEEEIVTSASRNP